MLPSRSRTEVSVSKVAVCFIGALPEKVGSLAAFLAIRGVDSVEADVLQVEVDTFADCYRGGGAVAEFISHDDGSYELHMNGPGAAVVMHELHTDDDAEGISLALASCAGLQ